MREATLTRRTRETDIQLTLALDGAGKTDVHTGIGFFDHMLDALCRFGMLDLTLVCKGDLEVDAHHTVEDVGLCLGQALKQALGEKRGIRRLAHAFVPMDEALAFVALDISNRPLLCWEDPLEDCPVGGMNAQLAEEFFRAVATSAGLTLHLKVTGRNAHHMLEALFKAFGRALDDAKALDPRSHGVIPSTKGTLA